VLPAEVARFQAEIQRLAFAAVRAVIEQELAQRRAKPERAAPRKRRPARPAERQLELGLAPEPKHQLELPLARQAAPEAAQRTESPAETEGAPEPVGAQPVGAQDAAVAPAAPEPQPSVPAGGRGRARWTRESIVSELATWLLSGTAIDAQFMTRHGPRGLVAAARRIRGRFDAALNLAALHNAKLYPEGPPARGTTRQPGGPPMAAATSRHEQK
jgi:hypothetical protein